MIEPKQNDAKGQPRPKNRPKWQVDIIKLLSTGAVAALAATIGSVLTYKATIRDTDLKYENLNRVAELQNSTAIQDLKLKMVDLSLAILAGDKGGADVRENEGYVLARDFAIKALSKASDIPISDKDREVWAKAGAIRLGTVTWQVASTAPSDPNANAPSGFAYADEQRTKLTVCIGERFERCPPGTRNHFTCDQDIKQIVERACPVQGDFKRMAVYAGNRCGYGVYEITCTG